MAETEKKEQNITTLITAKAVAKMLSTSVRTVWRYSSSGRLPMPLTEEQKQYLVKNLDNCDAALADNPVLASIYCPKWRQEFRQKALRANEFGDILYPEAYGAPHFEDLRQFPRCYQQRLEEGARILLPKLITSDRNGLITRLRGNSRNNPASGAEELLLARGFALQFGTDSIEVPQSDSSKRRPEFIVNISGKKIEIEAKGLLDSQHVQQLNQSARTLGQNYWISLDSSIGDPKRVRRALAKKIFESAHHSPCIIVLTLYSGFDFPVGFDLARQMALCPGHFRIPETQYPLAVALASDHRRILGVWFNSTVLERESIDGLTKERLRSAVRQSFYACTDSVFFDESMSEDEHEKMLECVRARRHS